MSMTYGNKYCDCGAEAIEVLLITLGLGTGTNRGMKRTDDKLPLCAKCLEKERRQEAERYGRGEDRRAHFSWYEVWR